MIFIVIIMNVFISIFFDVHKHTLLKDRLLCKCVISFYVHCQRINRDKKKKVKIAGKMQTKNKKKTSLVKPKICFSQRT